MGKVIQFPRMIEEEIVDVQDVNEGHLLDNTKEEIGIDVAEYIKIKPIEHTINNKEIEKKSLDLKNIFNFMSKINLKNKLALGLIAIAVVSISIAKAECSEGLNDDYSYIEKFNISMAEELSEDIGDDMGESSNQEDIIVTINPMIEGEEFAIYKATVDLKLKSSDIKVKNGEKIFKVKDVEINILDVSPELSAEDMAILPEESIKVLAKESASLAKKLKKELKKQDKYIEELIKSNM